MTKEWWDQADLGMVPDHPWLHPAVIDFFASLLRPEMTVFEFGAGGSTLWLAQRVAEVISVEANPQWERSIRPLLPPNVWLFSTHADLPFGYCCDILYVDGHPASERGKWLEDAPRLVKHDGWVILDNSDSPKYLDAARRMRERAEYYITFHVTPPGQKWLDTEFYRLKA